MGKKLWVSLVWGCFALAAWSQDASPPFALVHRHEPAPALAVVPTAPQTVTIPAETEVAVQMLSGIHTKVSRVNDPVTARLLQPVYVNGRLALPPGSLLDGRVTLIRSSGHLHRPAELGLRFDRIMLPDGQAKPIAAVLAAMDKPEALQLRLDGEGHLNGGRGFSWKLLLGGFVAFGTFGAVKAAAVSSAAISTALPVGGAALFGYEILWARGREVNLPPDTRCHLRLNYPLTVRVPW